MLTDYSGGQRGARLDPKRVQTEAARFLGDLDKVYPGALAAATRDARRELPCPSGALAVEPAHEGSVHVQPARAISRRSRTTSGKPVGNLFFAGEHTSSFYEWQGFMEGGAVSGLRAAAEVLRAL